MDLPNGNASPKRTYEVVVAASRALGISKDGNLPWDLPTDAKFYDDVTTTTSDPSKRNAVIMGRKSWETIPVKDRPQFGRLNVVLTRSDSFDTGISTTENVIICGSLISALELLATSPYCLSIEKVFVIGGGEILKNELNAPSCDAIHITEIDADMECDVFIPPVDLSQFQPWYSSFPIVENNMRYTFVTYVRVKRSAGESNSINTKVDFESSLDFGKLDTGNFSFLPKMIFERHEELSYLRLVKDIISNGTPKEDRTGTGTLSKFGCQMRFNLRKTFPLLTTKRVFWRGVVEELLWFISGSTNAKVLQEKGIHIWDGNASRDYLDRQLSDTVMVSYESFFYGNTDSFSFHISVSMESSPKDYIYRYTNMHADYTEQGFDQLLDVIEKIKTKPNDRRIVLSAWNPSDLNLMALPPCHMFAQFYVANGELSCQMYQRSAEMGLGVPFNIASYALLTCMIAHVCDLIPGDFIHVIGDAHVYSNHIKPLQVQLQKLPKPFPVLKINPQKKDINSIVLSDLKLSGYDPHERIDMKMAV
ncbi:hypothetical protein MKW94_016060 [Papaver nudicaule]|uniref:Bifunctional dihydrofolate reductase-thymidylate synthase n=1 Tax=Papaver nudicaule TaxID=74823 RepID=A0AA41W0M7_PAPNU|nr:hypothetical protein [Papaver nudicaule]